MVDTVVPPSNRRHRSSWKPKKRTQKERAGTPANGTANGPSQVSVPSSGSNIKATVPEGADRRGLSNPPSSGAVGEVKETVTSIPSGLAGEQGQNGGQLESSCARENCAVASASTERASPKGAKWKGKKGKKYTNLRLDSTQVPPLPANYSSTFNAQHERRAATSRPMAPTQALPEKEFSEEHFPALGSMGSVGRGKRTTAKPSEWTPRRNPKRDEAERLALLRVEQQKAEEEGRLSWLRDPLNPINGGKEPTSSTAVMANGLPARVFKAPYIFDENWKFGKPYKKQTSKLFTLATESLSAIFYQLDRRSRQKFARTSRASSALVGMLLTVWDMSSGDFCDAEKGPIGCGSPTEITIITEFRGSLNKCRVAHEVKSLKAMTLSLSLWSSAFRVLEFYRAPLVTARILSMVLRSLPNLEYLGSCTSFPSPQSADLSKRARVYSVLESTRGVCHKLSVFANQSAHLKGVFGCDLVNVGDSVTLLLALRNNIQLDFFPRMMPICHDVNIPIRIALPALLFTILPLAKKKNSRLMERGSAFREYLTAVLFDIEPDQYEKIEAGIQDTELTELVSSFKEFGKYTRIDPRSNNGRFWKCTYCDLELRGCFFSKSQLKDMDDAMCWGCKLNLSFEDEKWDKNQDGHCHREVENWLGNSSVLEEAVGNIDRECGVRDAGKTFLGLQSDDKKAKMVRKKFWNPRFYREAQAAWEKGEDPNNWWPEKQPEKQASNRKGRGGWPKSG